MPADPVDLREIHGDLEVPRVVTGDVYTDGALRGRCGRVLRGGWAFVLVDAMGGTVWGMCGTMSERYASVLRSELKGVIEALRYAVGVVRVHTDNALVVKGFARGPKWCTSPKRAAADLWRELWRLAEPIRDQITVLKVKAHLPDEAVAHGLVSRQELLGNRAADELAKRGARMALECAPTQKVEAAFRQAIKWLKWSVCFAAHWDEAVGEAAAGAAPSAPRNSIHEEQRLPAAPRPPPRAAAPWRLHASSPHLLWESRENVLCRRCGRGSMAAADKHRRAFARTRCGGTAAGRLAARLGLNLRATTTRCRVASIDLAGRGYRPITEAPPEADSRTPSPARAAHADADGGHGRLHDDSTAMVPRPAPSGDQLSAEAAWHPPQDDHLVSAISAQGDQLDINMLQHKNARQAGEQADPQAKRPRLLPAPAVTHVADDDLHRRDEQRSARTAKRARLSEESGTSEGATATGAPAGPSTEVTWLPSTRWGRHHQIQINGPVAFCKICGRYALERVGQGLLDTCRGPDADARARIERLLQGRHPLSGRTLLPD